MLTGSDIFQLIKTAVTPTVVSFILVLAFNLATEWILFKKQTPDSTVPDKSQSIWLAVSPLMPIFIFTLNFISPLKFGIVEAVFFSVLFIFLQFPVLKQNS